MPGSSAPPTPSPRSQRVLWLLLAIVLALAAQLRFGAVLKSEVDVPLRADAGQYFLYAANLKTYGIYSRSEQQPPAPDAVRTPAYPLLIAALMDDPPTERTLLRITMVQAALGILTVLICFACGLQLGLSRPLALLAAALTAISPHLISADAYVLTESLYGFTVACLLWVLLRTARSPTPRWLFAAGLMLGLCALVRPTLLHFSLLVPALLWLQSRRSASVSKPLLPGLLAFALGLALAYGPWLARNWISLGRSGDSELQINMLHHGLYPDFQYEGYPESFGFPYRFDPRAAEIASSTGSVLQEMGRRFAESPGRQLHWYLLGKPVHFWGWDNDAQGWGDVFTYPMLRSPYFEQPLFVVTHELSRHLHVPGLLLAAAFCAAVWCPTVRRRLPAGAQDPACVLALLLMFVTALHMLGAPFPRYSIPFRPELYLAACAGLALIWRLFRPAGTEPR